MILIISNVVKWKWDPKAVTILINSFDYYDATIDRLLHISGD
jgi:hypothetical protein